MGTLKNKRKKFDYKNYQELESYLSERGDLLSGPNNKLSPAEQRDLARNVKRARHLALLPFVTTL